MQGLRRYSLRAWIVVAIVLVSAVLGLVIWLQSASALPGEVFAVRVPGGRVAELVYSPNGEFIASRSAALNAPKPGTIRLFRVLDRELVFEHAADSFSSTSWNLDGSLLVVAKSPRHSIELLDSRTWTIQQSLPYPGADLFGTFTFDRAGNLFSATRDLLFGEMPNATNDRAVVWWNTGPDGHLATERALIDATDDVFNIAVSSISDTATRLVVSFENEQDKFPLEVRLAARQPDGNWSISKQYDVPGIGQAWIRMTPDGKYLAVLTCRAGALSIYQIHDTHLDHVWTAQGASLYSSAYPAASYFDSLAYHALEISGDGRVVACRFKDHIKVFDLVSRQVLLDLPSGRFFAISPDGQYLAVVVTEDHERIRVLRIPTK